MRAAEEGVGTLKTSFRTATKTGEAISRVKQSIRELTKDFVEGYKGRSRGTYLGTGAGGLQDIYEGVESGIKNVAKNRRKGVSVRDVDTYENLNKRALSKDGIDHDHMPSFAAIKLSKERALGRELTATEAKLLKNSTNVMAVPNSVHRFSRTYKGRNISLAPIDSLNLRRAFLKDAKTQYKNLIEAGYNSDDIIRSIAEIHNKNKLDRLY